MDINLLQLELLSEDSDLPSWDLARRVDIRVRSAIDLGCGLGESTRVLMENFYDADIIGLDNNRKILEVARRTVPEGRYVYGNIEDIQGTYDLIFSNSTLQIVGNHEKVIPMLMEHLNEDGVLAVSFPRLEGEPAFQKLKEIQGRHWQLHHKDYSGLSDLEYHHILKQCSSSYDFWETTYSYSKYTPKQLANWFAVWMQVTERGTIPDDVLEAIKKELCEELSRDREVYDDGTVVFKVKRVFFTAVK